MFSHCLPDFCVFFSLLSCIIRIRTMDSANIIIPFDFPFAILGKSKEANQRSFSMIYFQNIVIILIQQAKLSMPLLMVNTPTVHCHCINIIMMKNIPKRTLIDGIEIIISFPWCFSRIREEDLPSSFPCKVIDRLLSIVLFYVNVGILHCRIGFYYG